MASKQNNAAWTEQDNCLYKSFRFADFSEAFAFMTRVALLAERLDHHPRWTNEYNQVECWLSTHSAGNKVTDKDRDMAQQIDRFVQEINS
jgi:4a-hydroxytetrahydrobiopterin dehydratase